jgi:hypothetical protein
MRCGHTQQGHIYKPLLTESQKKKKKKNKLVHPDAADAWSAQRFPAKKALKKGEH